MKIIQTLGELESSFVSPAISTELECKDGVYPVIVTGLEFTRNGGAGTPSEEELLTVKQQALNLLVKVAANANRNPELTQEFLRGRRVIIFRNGLIWKTGELKIQRRE